MYNDVIYKWGMMSVVYMNWHNIHKLYIANKYIYNEATNLVPCGQVLRTHPQSSHVYMYSAQDVREDSYKHAIGTYKATERVYIIWD